MKHFKLFTVIALLIMAIPCNAQLTINIRYTAPKGAAKKYVQEMEKSGIAARIRAVEGCIRYDYFFPADDPDGLLLIDEWADQAALDRYHASPMMNEAAALREKYKLGGRQIRMFNPLAPTVQPEKKTQTMNTTLTPRRQGLAVIAALEAKGDQTGLETALAEALGIEGKAAGINVADAKAILAKLEADYEASRNDPSKRKTGGNNMMARLEALQKEQERLQKQQKR